MQGISISLIELLIKGIPEGLLIVLALHVFTKTKIDWKKFFLLCLVLIIVTYLIRFLPIKLGLNTMLSLLILILLFQFAYKTQLTMVFRTVTSAIIIVFMIMVSEFLNIFLLELVFGQEKTLLLLNSNHPLEKSISTIPSTIFTAIFIFVGYLIINNIEKRKKLNGKTGKKISE